MSLRVFTPAKINWMLSIRGKREDGFHDIDTIYQALDWGDELIVRKIPDHKCLISCNFPGIPLNSENLIHRAWDLFRRDFGRLVGGVEIELRKSIPPGAGLGGGSSNAVGTMVALKHLFDLKIGPGKLEEVAQELGSDCCFFLYGGTAIGSGRGGELRELRNRLPETWLTIVWPGFSSSTAEAYRRLTASDYRPKERADRMAWAIESGNLEAVQKMASNAFYRVVSAGDIRYHELIVRMKSEQLGGLCLTGSGSAVFGIAASKKHAATCVRRLKSSYPVVVAVRLRHSGPMVSPL